MLQSQDLWKIVKKGYNEPTTKKEQTLHNTQMSILKESGKKDKRLCLYFTSALMNLVETVTLIKY